MKNLNIMLENELLASRSVTAARGRERQFPIVSVLVCCAALFLWPTASLAEGNTLQVSGGTPTWSSKINRTSANGTGFLNGSFSTVFASSYDSKEGTDQLSVPAPMPYNPVPKGGYWTGLTVEIGDYYTAESMVTATAVSNSPSKVTWSAKAAPFQITNNNPTLPRNGETAKVVWTVKDPVTAPVTAGDQITVTVNPDSSLGIIFPDATPFTSYSSAFSAFAQTDIAGLTSLYSLSINMSSATPGQVDVSFSSNPLLGLNDAAITSKLISGFQYDSTTGDYSFDPTGQEIDATFTVPDGISTADITTGASEELDASVVPEPSTFALLGFGTMSLFAYAWQTRREAARKT